MNIDTEQDDIAQQDIEEILSAAAAEDFSLPSLRAFLKATYSEDYIWPEDLAEHVGMTKQGLMQMLKPLFDAELLTKVNFRTSKMIQIAPTEKGKDLARFLLTGVKSEPEGA